jgi:hypothetical protein
MNVIGVKKNGCLLNAGVRPLASYHDSFLLPYIEIGKDSLFQAETSTASILQWVPVIKTTTRHVTTTEKNH